MMAAMQSTEFGPRFSFSEHEILADGTCVYRIEVQHFAVPIPADEEDDLDGLPEPIRHYVGLAWPSGSTGWTASPAIESENDTWAAQVERATRSFPSLEVAALFLYGFNAALRWRKGQDALGALPWRR